MRKIQIKDLLKRPLFKDAKVVASEKALNRSVTWVHIMEVTNVGQLINGDELILSTGIGWKDNEQTFVSFLEQLIERNAAGLVIELVNYSTTIPASVLQLALDHDFPLILFYKEVRYIDITQDLNSIFLLQHHQMVENLEKLSVILNDSLLSGRGIVKLMTDFYQFTSLEIMLFPIQGQPIFVPSCPKTLKDRYLEQFYEDPDAFLTLFNEHTYRPIFFLGQTFAYLFVQPNQAKARTNMSEFEILALDRGTTAIAQEVMRTMYYAEQKRHKEDSWVQTWLTGEIDEETLSIKLNEILRKKEQRNLLTVISEIKDSPHNHDSHYLSNIMLARSFFEARDFKVIISHYKNLLVFILFPPKRKQFDTHQEIIDIFNSLQKGKDPYFGSYGIGQTITNLEVEKSLKTAYTTLNVQLRVGNLAIPAYEYLHSYSLIVMMEENGSLKDYISFYLEKLDDQSNEKAKQLLLTLKYYLRHNGKKNETAKSLYVVRQTLYHRLEKIQELFGDLFSSHERRLAIELAILGYEYLYGPLDATQKQLRKI